jgi:hypothetical protein
MTLSAGTAHSPVARCPVNPPNLLFILPRPREGSKSAKAYRTRGICRTYVLRSLSKAQTIESSQQLDKIDCKKIQNGKQKSEIFVDPTAHPLSQKEEAYYRNLRMNMKQQITIRKENCASEEGEDIDDDEWLDDEQWYCEHAAEWSELVQVPPESAKTVDALKQFLMKSFNIA